MDGFRCGEGEGVDEETNLCPFSIVFCLAGQQHPSVAFSRAIVAILLIYLLLCTKIYIMEGEVSV
jgi:hypothetical protein